jgi:hypothetical protein
MSTELKSKLDFSTPVEVTDKAAYIEYLKWSRHPILNQKKLYTASDGTVINLALIKPQVEKKIQHLPEDERTKVMVLKTQYSQVHCRANGFKTQAYRNLDDGHPGGRKSLLESKQAEVIELFGRMFTEKEVHKVCIEDWKLDIGMKAIQDFKKKHLAVIVEKIEDFKRDYSDIRLSIKKSRLEELVWMYGQRKGIYNATKKESDYKLMLSTLEQVRKEAEGNSLLINGKLEIDQDIQINAHIRQEVFKQLNLKQIILGRISGKMGINPLMLQKTIMDSYYGKYFNQENFALEAPPAPSSEIYDFNRINQMVAQNDESDRRFLEATKIEPVRTDDEANAVKDQLMKKLLKMTSNAANVKNQLNS